MKKDRRPERERRGRWGAGFMALWRVSGLVAADWIIVLIRDLYFQA